MLEIYEFFCTLFHSILIFISILWHENDEIGKRTPVLTNQFYDHYMNIGIEIYETILIEQLHT